MFNWSWIHILCTRIRWWINWTVIIKTYIKFSFDTMKIFLKIQGMEHLNDTIRPQKNKIMIWPFSLWSTNTHMTQVIICEIKLNITTCVGIESRDEEYEFWKTSIPSISCLLQLVLIYHHILYQQNLRWHQKVMLNWIYTWRVHIKYLYNFKTFKFWGT